MIAWVFFRSDSILDGLSYLSTIVFSFDIPLSSRANILLVISVIIIDWLMRQNEREVLTVYNKIIDFVIMNLIFIAIFLFINPTGSEENKFIYFQF